MDRPSFAARSSNPEVVGDVLGQTIRGTMRVSPDGRFLAFPYDQEHPEPASKLAVILAKRRLSVALSL